MAEDAPAASRKRAQSADDEDELAATSAKRLRLDNADSMPSTAHKGLNAIASAISGVFGYNRQPQLAVAQASVTHPTAPVLPRATLPTDENADPKAAIQVLPKSAPPILSPSPAKFRPAIKMAALRGTKWDDGKGPKSPSPKKTTPGRKSAASTTLQHTPSKGTPGRPKGSPLKRATLADDPYAIDESPEKTSSISKTVGAKRLFASKSPAKSILTPTKRRGRPPKNVKFGSRLDDEVFFEAAPKVGRPRKNAKSHTETDDELNGEIICAICSRGHSKAPNEIILCDNCDYAVHQECYEVSEIPTGEWLCKSCAQEDILKLPKQADETPALAKVVDVPEIPYLDEHVRSLQRVLLDRCTGHRPLRMFGQQEAQDKARQLIDQTVVAGEGNSMLLIGARGSGKTCV
jgi:origin recognition complex subunit 4